VKTSRFISSHNRVQKPISFLCVARETLQLGTHPFRFVIIRYHFGHPACAQFSVPKFFCHSLMNCSLGHFGNEVMQLSYRHASICANFSFTFLKKFVRDQRWLTAPLFVVNISPSFGEFTAPLRHILPIHNVTINGNNL